MIKDNMNMESCENCVLNITYMKDRTKCIKCAMGEINGFKPIIKDNSNDTMRR